MDRYHAGFVTVAVLIAAVVGGVASPAAALDDAGSPVAQDAVSQVTTTGANATASDDAAGGANDSVAPGQRFAGVVGVQRAELDGELEERTLGVRVARANSNASKAEVVATQVNTVRDRLRELRTRQEQLREARRTGELSEGEYRARMAVVAAEVRSTRGLVDSTEAVSRDLPAETLESHGVNRTELDRLRQDADSLHGRDVAEIARHVVGDSPGAELGRERGAPEFPGPATADDEDDEQTSQRGNGRSADAGNTTETGTDARRPDRGSSNTTATDGGESPSGNENGGADGGSAAGRSDRASDAAQGSNDGRVDQSDGASNSSRRTDSTTTTPQQGGGPDGRSDGSSSDGKPDDSADTSEETTDR